MALRIHKVELYDTVTKETKEASVDLIKASLDEGVRIEGLKTVAELFERIDKKNDKVKDLKYIVSELKKELTSQEIRSIMENELNQDVENHKENINSEIFHKTAIEEYKLKDAVSKKENLADDIKTIIRNLIYNLKDLGYKTEDIATYVKEFMFIHNDYSCEINLLGLSKDLEDKDLIVPEGVKKIYINNTSQFAGKKVKFKGKLRLPETLEEIDDGVFDMCDGIKGKLVLPSNLKVVGAGAFRNCINLTGIELNDSIEKIDQNAFFGCIGIEGKLSFPNSLKKVGKSAFEGCKHIKEVEFQKGTLEIEKQAFCKCSGLEKLSLPSTLVKLGTGAFNECKSLKGNIEIPEGIKCLENYTFGNCEELNEVNVQGAEANDINRYAFEGCKKLEAVFIKKEKDKNYVSRFR